MNKSLTIRQLESADVTIIVEFMRKQSPEYLRFFYAFNSDETAISEMLAKDKSDIYSGIFWQANLIGIFMLRGWDEGYEIPSFGIVIDEQYRGYALLTLTLETAKLTCRFLGVKGFMLKHHPENKPFQKLQRMGFYQTGIEESTGNILLFTDV